MTRECGATRLTGIGHVELRVRNLQDSVRFYTHVFGLRPQEASPRVETQRVCVGAPASGSGQFSVVLSEGFPAGAELAGLDHVGMCVSTEQDVRDTYARARELGYLATNPRIQDGHYQAYVFDPDGYKLEVFADRFGTTKEGSGQGGSAADDPGDPFKPR